ncbi:MAG TPA: DUF1287 domain-containing protein [Caulobacteraceae bacterium]|jgi:hypothetical protein|nr:DUF1287 domain-containing protein [Caulobacteraceae bacterium]
MVKLARRAFLAAVPAVLASPAMAAPTAGERLAAAARAQTRVTRGYDPVYRRIAYPGGDVPRTTGVCCDVVIRAARDALGLDLQKLVHEDMQRDFAAYPSKRVWGLSAPDANIDHRRVLNLEVFFARQHAKLWSADSFVLGSAFPGRLLPGDILTWRLLPGGQTHTGMVVQGPDDMRIVHNIGGGAQEVSLARMAFARAAMRFRWPVKA